MKNTFAAVLLSALCLLLAAPMSASANDNNTPPSWGVLYFHDTSYYWQDANDDGTYRYDNYIGYDNNSYSYTLTAVTLLDAPDLALITGTSPRGSANGQLISGSYSDADQSSESSGSWYINGYELTYLVENVHYSVDLPNGQVLSSGTRSYTANGGSYYYTWDTAGNWTADQAVSMSYYPNTALSTTTLFGSEYTCQNGGFSFESHSIGDSNGPSSSYDSGNWIDSSTTSDGGSMDISFSWDTVSMGASGTVSGWDYYAGSFSGTYEGTLTDFNSVTWGARSSPTFAPGQLWVDGTLVNWLSGELTAAGVVNDLYRSVDEQTTLFISGQVKDFQTGVTGASVTLNEEPAGAYTTSGGFDTEEWEILVSNPNRGSPLFSVEVLYVDNEPFYFSAGYEDAQGNRTDTYSNSSGTLKLIGAAASPDEAVVQVAMGGDSFSGTYEDGVFSVSGVGILTEPLLEGVQAIWIKDAFYQREAGTNNFRVLGMESTHHVTISSNSPQGLAPLTGVYNSQSLTGGVNYPTTDVCYLTLNGDTQVMAFWAGSDGHIVASETLGFFPFAILVEQEVWLKVGAQYNGVITTETNTYVQDWDVFYGKASWSLTEGSSCKLLKIKDNSEVTPTVPVTMIDCIAGTSNVGGIYRPAARLFQSYIPGPSQPGLPSPMYGVLPQQNNQRWMLVPDSESNLPPSLMVRGQPWWFAGETGGVATYRGFYDGQEMTLGVADVVTGARKVELVDPVFNAAKPNPLLVSVGMLSPERRSTRLDDGTLVVSGSNSGEADPVTPPSDANLYTIAMDLDIVGNNLSFGILNDDASLAGTQWSFRDNGSTASLHSSLNRTSADWYWWKQDAVDPDALRAVMVLDSSQRLQIYAPAPASTLYPGVVLDPAGTSSFKGPVRAAPGGDITMGAYTEGPLP